MAEHHILESDELIVYPWQLPSLMRVHIYTGAMGSIYFQILCGVFFVAFGRQIGLSYKSWGLMGAGTAMALVAQIASAQMASQFKSRKILWLTFAILERLLRAGGIFVAYLFYRWHVGWISLVLVSSMIISNVFSAMAAPPWFSWLADIIPEKVHGSFMGVRAVWISVATVFVLVPSGYLLDRLGPGRQMGAMLAIFALGTVVGLLDLAIHQTIPEPPLSVGSNSGLRAEVMRALRDRRFRPWLGFVAWWSFGMTLGGALAMIYFVEDLGLNRNFTGATIMLVAVPLIASAFCGRVTGVLIDRLGIKKLLSWGHAMWASLPLYWMVATPHSALLFIGLGSLIAGMGSSVAENASTKLVCRLPAREDCAMYVALSSSVGTAAGAFGPLVAGYVLEYLKGSSWTFMGRNFGPFHLIFAASLVLRFGALPLIRLLHEPARTG